MFGLIGHLNSLEHAQAVAQVGLPGTPTRAGFWCSAAPNRGYNYRHQRYWSENWYM